MINTTIFGRGLIISLSAIAYVDPIIVLAQTNEDTPGYLLSLVATENTVFFIRATDGSAKLYQTDGVTVNTIPQIITPENPMISGNIFYCIGKGSDNDVLWAINNSDITSMSLKITDARQLTLAFDTSDVYMLLLVQQAQVKL